MVDNRFTELNHKTCVVLGGSGFVGRSLVLRLLKLGNWIVRIADSPQSIQLDHSHRDSVLAQALSSGRASYFPVSLRDKRQIVRGEKSKSIMSILVSVSVLRKCGKATASLLLGLKGHSTC